MHGKEEESTESQEGGKNLSQEISHYFHSLQETWQEPNVESDQSFFFFVEQTSQTIFLESVRSPWIDAFIELGQQTRKEF